MGSLGMAEVLVIALVGLLVVGPERLPTVVRQVAQAIARFRAEATRSLDELKDAADLHDLNQELTQVRSDLTDLSQAITAPVDGSAKSEPTPQLVTDGDGATDSVPAD